MKSYVMDSQVVFTLDYNEYNEYWYAVPWPWGRSLATTILFRLKHYIYARKTFRKNGVKRKQKEQLLILLFVNLLLHLCCLWKLLKITKMENKII